MKRIKLIAHAEDGHEVLAINCEVRDEQYASGVDTDYLLEFVYSVPKINMVKYTIEGIQNGYKVEIHSFQNYMGENKID